MKINIQHNINTIAGAKKIRNVRMNVGWFEDSKYNDNTKIGDVAYYQEYGTSKGIPQRPFMRPAQMENEELWQKLFTQEVKKSVERGEPIKQAMERLGLVVQGDIQKAITDVMEPPLKESTIKGRLRRGNTSVKPLVDTGMMLATVQHKVEEK